MQSRNSQRPLFLIAIFIMGVLWTGLRPLPAAGSDKITLYFYSSETNINNYRTLKTQFDGYLAKKGAYDFQPVKDRAAFELETRECDNCLVLMSSWHYRQLSKTINLEPVLIGAANGRITQKRILVGKTGGAANIDSITAIASASSRLQAAALFSGLLKQRQLTHQKPQVLTVPKDIDALMSVGFGISRVALTSEAAMERLKIINPKMHARLGVWAECAETLLPVLAVRADCGSDSRKFLTVIQKMALDDEGRRQLSLIGLDGWQPVGEREKMELGLVMEGYQE
jgi:hypothetical protein